MPVRDDSLAAMLVNKRADIGPLAARNVELLPFDKLITALPVV